MPPICHNAQLGSVGQELAFSWWRTHRKQYLLGDFGNIASIASTISPARYGSNGTLVVRRREQTRCRLGPLNQFLPTDELGNLLDHLFFNAA
jgi:hypothetical protein